MKHPKAMYVVGAYPRRRHYRGWHSDGRVLCFWWIGRQLTEDQGVYDLPVCGRCAAIVR